MDPGIEPWSPALQADSLTSEPPGKPSVILNQPKILIKKSYLVLINDLKKKKKKKPWV